MTFDEIARKLNVSRATVYRVINGGYVSKNKSESIKKYLKKSNFIPNYNASNLAAKKSKTIGLVLPYFIIYDAEFFLSEVIKGVSKAINNTNCKVMLFTNEEVQKYEYLRLYQSKTAGGFLFFGMHNYNRDAIHKICKAKVPSVLVTANSDRMESFDCNNVNGGYIATNHLITTGRKKIGFIHGNPIWANSADRYKGYLKAMREAGLMVNPKHIVNGYFSFDKARNAYKTVLNQKSIPDAVFAANDLMALGVISLINEMKMKVPNDIAVIGYDDISLCKFSSPPLTTVIQPISEMTYDATLKIIKILNNTLKMKPATNLYEPKLIIRSSA